MSKTKAEWETFIQTVRIYTKEKGNEKLAMQVLKSDKRYVLERVELTNQIVIRTLGEKETYKYLEILEADTIKQ